jgi:hypothetical protein
VERVGTKRYNELLEEHVRSTVIETVNGYTIRPVQSRFGQLYTVDGLGVAFRKVTEARDAAIKAPKKSS